MCSCEQDRMNIKLKNSAMGGSSSPKLSDSSSLGYLWWPIGLQRSGHCREVKQQSEEAIVERWPYQRQSHYRDLAIVERWLQQIGGHCSDNWLLQSIVSIVERGGHCKELVIVERWPLQRGGHCCCIEVFIVQT